MMKLLGEDTLYCWLFNSSHWIPCLRFTEEKVFVAGQVVAEFSLPHLCQAQKQGRTFSSRKDVWSFFSLEAG